MTTKDLERRLAAVLRQHAEDAMNDTNTEERLETLLVDAGRDSRRRRRVWATGGLAAAAAVTAAVIAWVPGLGADDTKDGPNVLSADEKQQAVQVANGFISAYGSFDRPEAASYLADSVVGLEGWRRENRWFQAVGFLMGPDPCRAQDTDTAGETLVLCRYDFDALRSDRLGMPPFTGSQFAATVRGGEIVAADLGLAYENNGFSAKVWEPFAAWVSEAHPRDAAVMYADWPSTTLAAHTPRADRLWRQRTLDYVKEQRAANLAPG